MPCPYNIYGLVKANWYNTQFTQTFISYFWEKSLFALWLIQIALCREGNSPKFPFTKGGLSWLLTPILTFPPYEGGRDLAPLSLWERGRG
jgi:hypothetical protein